MIMGSESYVGEYWFLSYKLKEVTNSYDLNGLGTSRIVHIFLQPDVRLRWGLDQNVAFLMDK